jgi:HD-GYP domain-containing protein (c-di-GMP phosphodiesterase class II)
LKKYRTIPVSRLKVGDHVIGIDKSWLETPFLAHRFHIRSTEDIDRLKALGVAMVTVDEEASEQNNTALPPPVPETPPPLLREVSLPSYKVAEMLTSLHKYLVYKYKALFEELRRMPESGKIDTTPFLNALEEVEKLGRQYPDAYLFLAHLQSTDDETFIHSVNTMFLSLYLAHFQGSTQEDAVLWGLSGLFHDLGKVHIPPEILHKPTPLTPEDWDIIQDHPVMGQKLLAEHSNLPPLVARVAGEHHVRRKGRSYPDKVLYDATDSVTRAIMILDTFDAMTSDRSYRQGISPSKALRNILEASRESLDPEWSVKFFLSMGIYPVGTVVELSDGEVGVVTKYHSRNPAPGKNPGKSQSFSILILKNRRGLSVVKPFIRHIEWTSNATPPVQRTWNHSDFNIDWDFVRSHASTWM